MVAFGLRTRATGRSRISLILKSASTQASNKFTIGGLPKQGGREPKSITLAPIKGASQLKESES